MDKKIAVFMMKIYLILKYKEHPLASYNAKVNCWLVKGAQY